VKFLASHEIERGARKQAGETVGWVAGRLANLGANLSERADTRGWTLLPDRIGVLRIALPPGEHHLRLEVLDDHGEVSDTLDLGRVTLEPRGTLVLNHRVWGDEMGDIRQLRAHTAPAAVAARVP